MSHQQTTNPALVCEEFLVPDTHARCTRVFLDFAGRNPASGRIHHPGIRMKQAARTEMVQAVSREVGPTVKRYVEGNTVSFRMHAHIAVADV